MFACRPCLPILAASLTMLVANALPGAEADDQFAVAAGHFSQQRWELACDEFHTFLAKFSHHPLAPRARFFAGESLVRLRRYDEAASEFRELLEQKPEASLARKALFRAGESSYLAGQTDAAWRDLQRFADRAPADALNAYVWPYLGDLARERGDLARAERCYRLGLERFPQGPLQDDCRFGLARTLELQASPSDEGRRLYEALAAKTSSPWSDDAQFYLAGLQRAAGQNDAAATTLAAFEARWSDSPLRDRARLARGETLLAAGRAGDARQQFEMVIRAKPDGDVALDAKVGLLRALLAAKDHAAIDEQAKAFLAEHPRCDRRAAIVEIVACSQLARRDYAAARNTLEALPVDDEQPTGRGADLATPACRKLLATALLGLARECDQRHETDAAARLYERLVDEFADADQQDAILYNGAWAERAAGNVERATAWFARLRTEHRESRYWADAVYRLAERALETGDEAQAGVLVGELLAGGPPPSIVPHALYLQARAAVAGEQWAAATPPLDRLLREFPTSELRPTAEFWLAECAYRQEKYDDARERFAAIPSPANDTGPSWMPLVLLRRAQLLAHEKEWLAALESADPIGARYPDFEQQFEVEYLRGRCLAAVARFDEAREAYARVIESPLGAKTETAARAQWMIGESYFHQKNFAAALREYLRVDILYAFPTWQAAALLQAGKCQEALGAPSEARALYERVLKNHSDTRFAADAARRLKQRPTTGAAP